MFKHNVIICIFGMQGVKANVDIFNDMKMLQMNEVAAWKNVVIDVDDDFWRQFWHQILSPISSR